uniref:Uncharacterized protein n=1 Tax=Trichinella nativa TaxID=6335 RepID=A0A0V1KJ60_9BILA
MVCGLSQGHFIYVFVCFGTQVQCPTTSSSGLVWQQLCEEAVQSRSWEVV